MLKVKHDPFMAVNKVILIGNLGQNPEIRTLESGIKMARFSLATSEIFTDKATGDKRTHTEWHRIVLWRKLAELAEKPEQTSIKDTNKSTH